jgi:hypothetical protein
MKSSGSFPPSARTALAFCAALAWLGCSKSPKPARTPNDWPAAAQRSDASARERVALTVYNSNFALVREQRRLRLGRGRVALAYEDVAAQLQPATVHLQPLGSPDDLSVLEQNYRYDLLTPEKLLEKYVGRQVSLLRYDRAADDDVAREAQVLASATGPVLQVAGEVTSLAPDERIRFPELPPGLLARPTLIWLLDSAQEEQRVEVSYLTQNVSWRADYVLALAADDAHGDLTGWVTLDNQSGASFPAASLQLIAGEVQRVTPPQPELAFDAAQEKAVANHSAMAEEPLFEYHLYTLDHPTDVLDRESKQVQLLEARNVAVERKLVLRRDSRIRPAFAPNGESPALEHAAVVAVIANREQAGLGMPLPRGIVRVYRADAGGAQQFVGEDSIDHTPRDEDAEITLGAAFDVVAERQLMQVRQLERCVTQHEWRISLRNHKASAVTVEVQEPASGDWQVAQSTLPAEKRDANTILFRAPVPAGGTTELRYQLRTRTCD